jgi:Rrf2 family protein
MTGPSKTFSHAMQALACLARRECAHGMIRAIASCSGVPAPYLVKIIKRLQAAGIVACKRGQGGGVWLLRSPRHISALQVYEAVEGPDARPGPAAPDGSVWNAFWMAEQERLRSRLARLSLASLATPCRPNRVKSAAPSARRIAA